MTQCSCEGIGALLIAIGAASCLRGAEGAQEPHPRTLTARCGDLQVLFRDNSRSPALLSGIGSLVNFRAAKGYDAIDPEGKGASAGLNFEHIICGSRNPNNKFTPRSGPYLLYPLPGQSGARLVRSGTDGPWNVSSTLEYHVVAPNAVDFQFRCTPHRADLFGPHGYAIFFFADYMNDVADIALHFRGVAAPGDPETWIAAHAPRGHPDWNGGGTYRHRDAPPLEYDRDLDFRLNSWSYDWPRYTEPFYFGRAAQGMTFILMFDRWYTPEDEIRFSLFKFKLSRHPRPAWDFQYVVHRVVAEREYGFRGRLVWKKFQSADDCRAEYHNWKATLRAGPRPRPNSAH